LDTIPAYRVLARCGSAGIIKPTAGTDKYYLIARQYVFRFSKIAWAAQWTSGQNVISITPNEEDIYPAYSCRSLFSE
jgi:hypothetical protein